MADDPHEVAAYALRMAQEQPGRLAQRLEEVQRERRQLLHRLGRLDAVAAILEAARDMAAGEYPGDGEVTLYGWDQPPGVSG